MKQKLLLFIFTFLSITLAKAQTFAYNGINYNITSPSTVEVGDNSSFSGHANIPSIVTDGSLIYDVTRIGDNAFLDNEVNLTSVTIPNSVTTIGESAFNNCDALTSITIPISVTEIIRNTFANCNALASVTMSSSVTSIGESAFSGCSSLASIALPNSITTIESQAFFSCTNLASITIPDSVTSIGSYAFYYCGNLTSLTLSNSLESIGSEAFGYCSSLASLTIPNSVTSIGFEAFGNCTGLNTVNVSWPVPVEIDYDVFHYVNLSSVVLNIPVGTNSVYAAANIWTEFNFNHGPSDISLSSSSINENTAINSAVGVLTSVSNSTGNTYTYTLVSGAGSTDNTSFNISGGNLRISVSPNFETQNSYFIRVRTTDQDGVYFEKTFAITINNVNENPTDISLSSSAINENVVANSVIGSLSTTDVDAGNTFTYSLVSGTGSDDNTSFNINGSDLRISGSPDFETQNTYSIRIRTTDQGGLFFEKEFIITILDTNESPTDISLSSGSINENVAVNSVVGVLTTTSSNTANTFTYALVSGAGSTDNALFNINGSDLRISASPDFETQNNYSVRIRSTEQGGLFFEKSFMITINDINESPTDISLSSSTINENVAVNSIVGSLSSTDQDTGNTFTYTLVTGTGSTDNTSFNINGADLRISASPDFETKNSYTVRIRTTDQDGLIFEKSLVITILDVEEAPRGCWAQVSAGGYHTLAIAQDGTLWAWGDNSNKQLGNNSAVAYQTTPVQINSERNWAFVSAGEFHSLAIKKDGTLWAWGRNNYGQLGNNTTTQQNTPVQIGTDTNWLAISAGYDHNLAIKSDKTLWAWGRNNYAQIGNNTTTQQNVPVQIGTDANWSVAKAGRQHSLALKNNNTLWAWGRANFGQLGTGNTTQQNVPIQVGTDTDWKTIQAGEYYNLALKSNNTLWAWGDNFVGQLGIGNTNQQNSPVQIGADANWKFIGAGMAHSTAVKSTGTLWSWGDNYFGQIGNGNFAEQNSPVQVGTATDWYSVISGNNYAVAQKTSGNYLSWGDNQSGQLGNGSTTPNTTGQNIPGTMNCSGNVLAFDGVDDRVVIQNLGTGILGDNSDNDSYTIQMKVKIGAVGEASFVSKKTSIPTNKGYAIGTDASGNLFFDQAYGNVFKRVQTTTSLQANTWYAISATFDYPTKTHTLYLDGNQVGAFTDTATPNFINLKLTLALEEGVTPTTIIPLFINDMSIATGVAPGQIITSYLGSGKQASTQAYNVLVHYQFNQGNANVNNAGIITPQNEVFGSPYVGTLENFALTGSTSNWVYDNLANETLSATNFSMANDIRVYPNPSTGVFNVLLKQDASVEIHDMLGKVIYVNKVQAGTSIIDISNYQNGLYLLNIKFENGSVIKKLLKQ